MIQKLSDKIEVQLLNIIRGRSPLSDLSQFGIEITRVEGELKLHSNLDGSIVQPSLKDVLHGFRLYQEHPSNLITWSFFLLAETAVDLSELETTEFGSKLLDEIWNASRNGTTSALIDFEHEISE